nr:hypothetical protein [Tanacetum cinerariifolium]
MSSLFADTHNVVVILEKSDAAEGFEQIISGSYIHYALTVNPHIYISCIKQFWNTAFVKRSGNVTRLQALVDKKKIVISEAIIRKILQLDDAEGVVCLPNEEIFAGLAQMGYEKPSTKLTFYKTFFSSQWKFLIHTILQSLCAKRTFWNEFSTTMASAVICLSKGLGKVSQGLRHLFLRENVVEEVVEVANEAIPSPPSHHIPPPSQEQTPPPQQPHISPPAPPQGEDFPAHFQQVLDTCSALTRRVEHLEHDNVAQKLEIVKLKARVKRLERANQVKSSKFKRLRKVGTLQRIESSDDMEDADNQTEIYNLDLDHPSKVLSMQEDDSEVQEVIKAVTTAKLIMDVVTAASQVSAASTTISAAKPSIPAAAPTVVAAYTRRRKGVIIRDPEEELSLKTPVETPELKDKGKGILVESPKPMKKKDQIELDDAVMDHVNQKSSNNPQYIKRYQGMKKRPQTKSEARKNMMIYLKNTAGYKMDFFKGMLYADICSILQARFDENMRFLFKSREEMEEEDQEIIKSISETPAHKVAKRRKLKEEAQEAEEIKKQLEIVNDEDDDVFTEATPLGRKVPVVDYEIVMINNSPRYKIIRANDTHRLYISFITLLKNFDREDLKDL